MVGVGLRNTNKRDCTQHQKQKQQHNYQTKKNLPTSPIKCFTHIRQLKTKKTMQCYQRKYSGKDVNKIMDQKIKDEIVTNIKYKMTNLPFGIIKNMRYYLVLDVTSVITYAINHAENQNIKDEIKTNIKANIAKLRFITIKEAHYYSAFEIDKIIDNTINDLVRKIFF